MSLIGHQDVASACLRGPELLSSPAPEKCWAAERTGRGLQSRPVDLAGRPECVGFGRPDERGVSVGGWETPSLRPARLHRIRWHKLTVRHPTRENTRPTQEWRLLARSGRPGGVFRCLLLEGERIWIGGDRRSATSRSGRGQRPWALRLSGW